MAYVRYTDYLGAQNNYLGWCVECQDWTRDCTEPDAESYDCPECEQNTVVGAELALALGEIEVQFDVEDGG